MSKMTQSEQIIAMGMKALAEPKPQVGLMKARAAMMDSVIKAAVADDKYHLARGLKTRTSFFSKKVETSSDK